MRATVLLAEETTVLFKAIALKISKDKSFSLLANSGHNLPTTDFIVRHRPDIVIYDIDHNGETNGFPMLRQLRDECGDAVRVIAFSDCAAPEVFGAFFHHGGWGYELKSCPEDEIIIAIRCVSCGIRFICSSLGGEYIHSVFSVSSPLSIELLKKLTPTERKVLAIVRVCGSAKDVARELDMAVSTAEKHIERIMKKLEIHGLAKLRNSIWPFNIE